jgi:hypothetical protein
VDRLNFESPAWRSIDRGAGDRLRPRAERFTFVLASSQRIETVLQQVAMGVGFVATLATRLDDRMRPAAHGGGHSNETHAYDLSRLGSADKVERGFVTVQAGAWLPGPDTFNDNHVTSLQLGAELGIKVLDASDHHLFLVGGMTFSPRNSEPHLDELPVSLIVGFGGVRYVPGHAVFSRRDRLLVLRAGIGLDLGDRGRCRHTRCAK